MRKNIQDEIEEIIGQYCDRTLLLTENGLEFSLGNSHFIEYFADSKNGPQELADRLFELFKDYSHE